VAGDIDRLVRQYMQKKHELSRTPSASYGVTGIATTSRSYSGQRQAAPDSEIARELFTSSRSEGAPLPCELSSPWSRALLDYARSEVEWNFNGKRAEAAVRRIKGVFGAATRSSGKPQVEPTDREQKIEEPSRSAEVDAIGSSWRRTWARSSERERALGAREPGGGRAAWSAPGVDQGRKPDAVSL